MSERTITNNHPRPILDAWDLSPGERAEFDYLDWTAIDAGEESASFFRYRGEVYDLAEFMRVENVPTFSALAAWQGYRADSFFSAVVVRFTEDMESLVVGMVLS